MLSHPMASASGSGSLSLPMLPLAKVRQQQGVGGLVETSTGAGATTIADTFVSDEERRRARAVALVERSAALLSGSNTNNAGASPSLSNRSDRSHRHGRKKGGALVPHQPATSRPARSGGGDHHHHSDEQLHTAFPLTATVDGIAASGAAKLPADYVRNLKARMKMISSTVQTGHRTDPLAAWPMKVPSDDNVVNRALTKGKGRIVLNDAARPPLALEIEGFVRKEVQALTRLVPKPSILQLMPIYREAFSCFVGHFREYTPTLSLIQKHYDVALDCLGILQQRVDKTQTDLHSLKETFHIMLENETGSLKNQLTETRLLLDASRKLEQTRGDTIGDLGKELNALRLQYQELNEEYTDVNERYRLLASTIREQSAKSGKLVTRCDNLTAENDRLLHHVATLEGKILHGVNIDVSDDAALRRRSQARMSINPPPAGGLGSSGVLSPLGKRPLDLGLSVNLPDTPATGESKEDADLDNISELREALFEEQAANKKLNDLVQMMLKEKRVLQQRVEKLQTSKDDDTLTPRPKWISATEALPGFTPNQLQSSEEILDELSTYFKEKLRDDKRRTEMKAYSALVRQWLGEEDMIESDLADKGRYFVGKGTGPHVPVYLRHRGNVKNQRLRKGDVENLLARFWRDRRTYLRSEGQLNANRIDEFFLGWVRKESPSEKHAVRTAYNILAVCETHQSDPDCSLMLRILRGEISEMTIYDQVDMVERLHEIVASHDKMKKGAITRLTMQRILNRFFIAKSMEDMLRLRFALIRFCNGTNVVDYEALFNEDEEGNQTQFVEVMRVQHLQEVASFVVEVEEAIREVIAEDGTVMLGSAKANIKYLDPAMPPERIDEILAFGCKLTLDELLAHGDQYSVPAEPLLARIRTGVLMKRYSRKEEDDELEASTSSEAEDDVEDEEDDEEGEEEEGGEVLPRKRSKRRKEIQESGVERVQRQEEIEELLRDLNIDATGTKEHSDRVLAPEETIDFSSGAFKKSPAVSEGKVVAEDSLSGLEEDTFEARLSLSRSDSMMAASGTYAVIGDHDKAAMKERKRMQRVRKVSNAEALLIEQEAKLSETRRREAEELQSFSDFGQRYGIKGFDSDRLRAATEAKKAVEEQQSSQFKA